MFRTVVSLICAIAISAPAAALAGERHDRGFYSRGSYRGDYSNRGSYSRDYDNRGYRNRGYYSSPRTIERVRTIDFYNRNRDVNRRDVRGWESRDEVQERDWRDRRDDRLRREYKRDRYNRPSIILIPRLSF